MSADNFVGVYPKDGRWIVSDGSMSVEMEDCQYQGSSLSTYDSREAALVFAHDYAKTLPVLEYGVIEFPEIPSEPCKRCYVCVHERGLIDPSLRCCDKCGKTISDSECVTMMQQGVFHSMCAPPFVLREGIA